MGRTPCCDKANVKKGPWSPEEDARLKHYIEKSGTGGNWISLPQKAGLKRCGKSCRLRWLNYLRPDIKHGDFSEEEDRIIYHLFATIGSRWSVIAAQLPGRTDNDIKNYWNTKLKKKLVTIITTSQKNNHPQNPCLSSFLQPSSTNSSSSSSPSPSSISYSDNNNQTNYTPNPIFTIFDPMSFSTNLLNGGSFISNNTAQESSFINPMIQYQNFHVNDGLSVIGGETSSSSDDDGSCRETEKKKMMFTDCSWTETTPLEYGFEEIKKLIDTSGCSNIYFDEN